MITIPELLRRARALIADPDCWTQRTHARDADNLAASSVGSTACQWCAMGAIERIAFDAAAGEDVRRRARLTLHGAARRLFGVTAVSLNDGPTPATAHPLILAAFDAAIADLS